jgi:D-beta-D-heptose 7-phosphate kinase/D-beta-D-heptose 1-phosphate adenosyltransferase
MASFVMALLAGAGPVQAAHISNHAAGIVVGKVGTVAVQAEELRHELEREQEADEH